MNILSAIYAGKTGFLKAGESMAQKAGRMAQVSHSEEAQEHLAEDLVGMKLDSIQAKASGKVVKIADNLLNELVQDVIKR